MRIDRPGSGPLGAGNSPAYAIPQLRPLPLGMVGQRLAAQGTGPWSPDSLLPAQSPGPANTEWSASDALKKLLGIDTGRPRVRVMQLPPLAPPGVDIDANIREAEGKWNPWWFYHQVKNKGPWDYKQLGKRYANFGNFHYGATGAAFGFPETVLLNEAGKAQQRDGNTSSNFGEPGPRLLPFLGTGSYGDDPVDQYWIKKGIDFYNNREQWYEPPHRLSPPPIGP